MKHILMGILFALISTNSFANTTDNKSINKINEYICAVSQVYVETGAALYQEGKSIKDLQTMIETETADILTDIASQTGNDSQQNDAATIQFVITSIGSARAYFALENLNGSKRYTTTTDKEKAIQEFVKKSNADCLQKSGQIESEMQSVKNALKRVVEK